MDSVLTADLAASKRILVVEDNPTNVVLMEYVLRRLGYKVASAINAEQALHVVQSFAPHLILMDLQLPGMSGLDITRHLKADPVTRSIVIVAVTAMAMKGDEQIARSAGCDGYITKPIDTRTFGDLITPFLSA